MLEPSPGYFLGHGSCRTAGIDGCVLVPGRGEPIGGHRCRQRAADHPAKKTAAGGTEQTRTDITYQFIDHLFRCETGLGKGSIEGGAKLGRCGCRTDRPMGQAVDKREGMIGGASEKRGFVHKLCTVCQGSLSKPSHCPAVSDRSTRVCLRSCAAFAAVALAASVLAASDFSAKAHPLVLGRGRRKSLMAGDFGSRATRPSIACKLLA